MVEVDPLEQTCIRQVRLEKRVAGELTVSEENTLKENMYLKNEVLLLLGMAGFQEITVIGDYRDNIATSKHEEIVFTAIKQSRK